MIKRRKKSFAFLLCIMIFAAAHSGFVSEAGGTASAREPVVIVIDPGHGGTGGTNEGGIFAPNVEKYMTLLTAQAMKQTLEQFDGVTVYLTRTQDTEVSLEQRAQTAQDYGADFLFSLHYNMSADHSLYGTEVWTSAFGTDYGKGQTFANIHLQDMQNRYGLYVRGAKVRLNSRGSDYYGVIRASHARKIPCVIIEHCYLDNGNDNPLVATQEQMVRFGVTDAISVAKYFHLKSDSLGLDFTNTQYASVAAPAGGKAYPDQTAPVMGSVTVTKADASGRVQVNLSAADAESAILYYTWSTDGGLTWQPLCRWPAGLGNAAFEVTVPAGVSSLVFRVHNQYDLTADTAPVSIR